MQWRKRTSRDNLGISHGNAWGDWLAQGAKTLLDYVDTIYFATSANMLADMAAAIGRDDEAAAFDHALSQQTADAAARPRYICMAHTSQGADFAPALAIELKAACIGGIEDILTIKDGVCFSRPVYGGKIIAHIRPLSETSILTIQPGLFKWDKQPDPKPGRIVIRKIATESRWWRSMGLKQVAMDTQGISEAEVVVAAGQGIGDRDNLDLINQLAAIFSKSAVAGSRIVCDLEWLGFGCQVGVTGATVSPQLYIACGVSGAIQHVSGMRGSEFIVAINKDPAASIFQVADICVVEDLITFIPTLIEVYQNRDDQEP